jgi:FKBP-type peptidyl-prolyl cis-trans isomerase (trigger factor)
MRAELRPGAERSVKTGLVLEALARDAHLTPTDADVDAEIGRQAASQQSLDPAHYRRLAVRPETREAIAADLARRSAVRWLHDHALAAHGHSGAAAAEAPEARGGSGPAAGPAKGEDA